jgi:hypothetical protein
MARLQFDGITSIEGHMLLPKGAYAFEIDGNDPEYKSKDKGSRALELKVHVIEGPDFDDGTSTVGMERHMRLWFPTASQSDGGNSCARRFIEIANAAGVPGVTYDKDSKSVSIDDTDEFNGRRFVCTVAYQDYKGENQEDYKNYKPYVS